MYKYVYTYPEVTCGPPPAPVRSSLTEVTPGEEGGRYLYMSTATYRCDMGVRTEEGYTGQEVRCVANNTWDRETVICYGK